MNYNMFSSAKLCDSEGVINAIIFSHTLSSYDFVYYPTRIKI